MDYVTRQFIVLAKKFRKELPKLVDSLRKEIKQQTKSINELTDAFNQSRGAPKSLRPIFRFPIP